MSNDYRYVICTKRKTVKKKDNKSFIPVLKCVQSITYEKRSY